MIEELEIKDEGGREAVYICSCSKNGPMFRLDRKRRADEPSKQEGAGRFRIIHGVDTAIWTRSFTQDGTLKLGPPPFTSTREL